ncbi:dihydrodipicolinate synthase family protein [Nocardia sp. NPDC051052]|uniref:dihydrodipicolinate synthase family protein n=1 Tax=Nocardia sp. NPDC051052 TaxID=3364322 RepID=UPI0037913331
MPTDLAALARDQLAKVLRNGPEPAALDPDSDLADDYGLTSLNKVLFLTSLCQAAEIGLDRFTEDDLAGMRTLGHVIDALRSHARADEPAQDPSVERNAMFTGLSAFHLTPTDNADIDEKRLAHLVTRLVAAGVDLIGTLGSTGNYAYLDRAQRDRVAKVAVEAAGDIPVMIGIGALCTSDVLAFAEDAQHAGAAAVLLSPVSYQALTDEEVFGLYEDVTKELSVPLCVYENPRTTKFTFSDELHGRVAALPNVGAVKTPGVPAELAPARIAELRSKLPSEVAIGFSLDEFGVGGVIAGADVWLSVIGGLLPEECMTITRALAVGDNERAMALSNRMEPFWELFRRYGSMRVVTAAAEQLGLIGSPSLPRPLRGIPESARKEVAAALEALDVRV